MVQTLMNIPKMSPENFCYWLQGLFELQPDLKTLTPEQVAMIKQHLMYVFEGKQQVMIPEYVQPYSPRPKTPFIDPEFIPVYPQSPKEEIVVVC